MQLKTFAFVFLSFIPLCVGAQETARILLRKGNKAMARKEYAQAEGFYRKAFVQDSAGVALRYGLGNALYEQGKYKDALEVYGNIPTKNIENQKEAAQLFHNIGNAQLKLKQYAPAIENFKQSLRFNPTDDETRYNLALALKMLPKDQQQNQSNNAPSPNNAPNNQQKNKREEQKKSDEAPEKSEKIDSETAKKILDSYQNDEEKTRRKYEQMQRSQQDPEQDKNKKRW